jgi:hypothetical protein
MSWRGWVKVAFHQPLVPVLPVARELLSKTKWTSSKSSNQPHDNPLRLLHPRIFATDDDHRLNSIEPLKKLETPGKISASWRNPLKNSKDMPPIQLTPLPLTTEPESMTEADKPDLGTSRKRVKSLFSKNSGLSSKNKGPNSVSQIDAKTPPQLMSRFPH